MYDDSDDVHIDDIDDVGDVDNGENLLLMVNGDIKLLLLIM
jgi:hypothetical protein